MLKLADLFFICFHSLLVLFNLFGWIPYVTRKWNLVTLLLTGLSWAGLGIFYGMGYCPLTDWHFQVLTKMGQEHLPSSYMSYLLNRLFCLQINPELIDAFTLVFFLLALVASLIVNFSDQFKKWFKDGSSSTIE